MENIHRKYSKSFDISALDRDDLWKAAVAEKQKRLAEAILEKDLMLISQCPICQHSKSSELCKVYGYLYI